MEQICSPEVGRVEKTIIKKWCFHLNMHSVALINCFNESLQLMWLRFRFTNYTRTRFLLQIVIWPYSLRKWFREVSQANKDWHSIFMLVFVTGRRGQRRVSRGHPHSLDLAARRNLSCPIKYDNIDGNNDRVYWFKLQRSMSLLPDSATRLVIGKVLIGWRVIIRRPAAASSASAHPRSSPSFIGAPRKPRRKCSVTQKTWSHVP